MSYKNFYFNIVIRLLLLIGLTAASVWVWLTLEMLWISLMLMALAIIDIVFLVRWFNNINRWMAFFLLGIENEDTTLKPPPKSGNKSIDEVYRGMTRLNDLFKNAKIEISTQEQYFKKLIKQSATGLFSINEHQRIININPAAVKLTQLYEFQHVNSLKNMDDSLPGYLIHEPLTQTSAIFENQFGQKLLFKLSEIKTSTERLRLVAVSDITKELDNGEVEAWIKLARTLSHEIMNNIAPITTLSQVISGYFTRDNKAVAVDELNEKIIANTIKGLEVIEDRSSGLMRFVENYRKFTRLPEPDFKLVNLSELLNNALLAIGTYPHFETIRLIKKIPAEIFIETDSSLLNQVIHNILKNAYEALLESHEKPAVLMVKLQQNKPLTMLEISNNGPEIPPEIREQIFIPFFTTKENGSGVGLSLSKQMMLKMDGDIYFKTPEDKTSCFVLSFNTESISVIVQ